MPTAPNAIFAAARGLPPVRLLVNNAARFAWDGFGEFSAARVRRAHGGQRPRAGAADRRASPRGTPGGDALVVNLLDSKLAAPNPDYLSYTLSKQALAGLTELAARALAPRGIRVNGIAPGLMLRSSGQSEENFAAMHANNPLGRGVEPRGCGRRASAILIGARCVTGQVLDDRFRPALHGLDRDVQFLGTHERREAEADGPGAARSQGALGADPARIARGPGGHRLSRFRGRRAAAAAGHGRNLARGSGAARR